MRIRPTASWLLRGLVVLLTASAAFSFDSSPVTPDSVPGLLAWYDARTLYDGHRDREAVSRWPDASGNGHDLIDEESGLPTEFRTNQIGDKPVVRVGKYASFAVTEPFSLDDHTIFVVARSNAATQGLFSAARDGLVGVVFARDGVDHAITAGTQQHAYVRGGVGEEYAITVLGRSEGRLHGFVDGADRSNDVGTGTTLEVGRLFNVALSRRVTRDAEGLRVAELIFYDRFLTDDERDGVTEYLSGKYGLDLSEAAAVEPSAIPPFDWSSAKPQVSLGSANAENLNVPGLAVTWDSAKFVEAPFRFDEEQPTRLFVTAAGRVHLSARLWLRTSNAGTALRILMKRNEDDWLLDHEATTEPDPGETEGTRLIGRLDLSVDAEAGDYFEVVVSQVGADGSVTLMPGESALLAIAAGD